MESDSLVGRIGSGDFLSVLPGGFFVFLTGALAIYAPAQAKDLIASLKPPIDAIKENPYYILLVLFCTFLIGSVIRSFPVNWAERISPPFSSRFPFTHELRKALKALENGRAATMHDQSTLPNLRWGMNRHIWNYWKDMLCCRNEKAFRYYQSFEIRARYAAGLIWAGVCGMLSGTAMLFRSPHVGWQIIAVSAAIYVAYSFHIRRMREVEARALLFLFVAQQQPVAPESEHRSEKSDSETVTEALN